MRRLLFQAALFLISLHIGVNANANANAKSEYLAENKVTPTSPEMLEILKSTQFRDNIYEVGDDQALFSKRTRAAAQKIEELKLKVNPDLDFFVWDLIFLRASEVQQKYSTLSMAEIDKLKRIVQREFHK